MILSRAEHLRHIWVLKGSHHSTAGSLADGELVDEILDRIDVIEVLM